MLWIFASLPRGSGVYRVIATFPEMKFMYHLHSTYNRADARSLAVISRTNLVLLATSKRFHRKIGISLAHSRECFSRVSQIPENLRRTFSLDDLGVTRGHVHVGARK